jgi:hypothetical protein
MNKKNLLIVSAAIIFFAILGGVYFSGALNSVKSTPATASLDGDFGTGANIQSIYGSLNTAISNKGTWQAEMRNDHIALVDAQTRAEVAKITKVSDKQITFSSVVASLGALPAEQKTNIKRQIDDYNMSGAAVGTMQLEENGNVIMKHNVDPTRSSADEIAKVAVMFGEKTREQSQKYGVMKLAANS